MPGQASGKAKAAETAKTSITPANEKAKKRPRNKSKSGLTPESKTNKQVEGGADVIREIDACLGDYKEDKGNDRPLVREAKLKLHGGESDMPTVEEVGMPPLDEEDEESDDGSAADHDGEPTVKRVRSDVEVRIFRWDGAKKSISQEQWSMVYEQLTIALLDPRNSKILEEVQNRDRPITNTGGGLRYGVIGTATEEGAKAIQALLHGIQFKKKLQIQAKVYKNTVPDIPTKVNIKVNSLALHGIAETLVENFGRQNELPGKVLDFRANDIRQGSRFWFLEIFPDQVMLKALEEKKERTIKIGLLETKLELIRNIKKK